jgi:hypothetical protein
MNVRSYLSLLTGSFSTPAAANPTVVMVEAAYRHHGLDARYINCEVSPDALGDAVRGARAMGWKGFNCSIPHKVAVTQHLDGLAGSALLIGAVNCVVNRESVLIGENTDGRGFGRLRAPRHRRAPSVHMPRHRARPAWAEGEAAGQLGRSRDDHRHVRQTDALSDPAAPRPH